MFSLHIAGRVLLREACNSPLSSELSLTFTTPFHFLPLFFTARSQRHPTQPPVFSVSPSLMSPSHPHFSPLPPFSHNLSPHLFLFLTVSPSLSSSLSILFFFFSLYLVCPLHITHPACHEQSRGRGTVMSHDRIKAFWLEQLQGQRQCDREDAYLWGFVYLVM